MDERARRRPLPNSITDRRGSPASGRFGRKKRTVRRDNPRQRFEAFMANAWTAWREQSGATDEK